MPRVPEGQGWDPSKDVNLSVEKYFQEIKALIPLLPYEAIEAIASVLLKAFAQDRTVFVFGNGGSAAIASHMMCDLNKGSVADAVKRPKVMALTDNVSLVTAWANDCGYEHIFSEQLKTFIQPHDVAFAISTSGDSSNVLLALETAQEYGGVTLGFAGYDGGRMKALCDVCAVVPSDHVQVIEDMHHAMAHSVFTAVRKAMRAGIDAALAARSRNVSGVMKIAFDLRRIKNPGIGRYMRCLAEAVVAHAPEHDYLMIMPPGGEELVNAPKAEKIAPRVKYYSLHEQIALPRILHRHKVDLLHAPHFLMPLVRSCPAVATIHDVIYLSCPQDLPSRMGRLYYRAMIHASSRLAARVITDSEFSKRDIVQYLRVDPARIEVIYPGVAPEFRTVTDPAQLAAVRNKYGVAGDYVLCVGIYKPRKNHAGLLRAFHHFLATGGSAQLVIAGPLAEGEQELRRLAAELGIAHQVVFTGFVNEHDLPSLYSGARVCACPSFYEGFGFTALEAMACGTPVVCSSATSLPEVAGDGALYADPHNAEEFGERLLQVCADPALRAALIEKGKMNLLRFSWARAAEQTLSVYQQALRVPLRKAAYA